MLVAELACGGAIAVACSISWAWGLAPVVTDNQPSRSLALCISRRVLIRDRDFRIGQPRVNTRSDRSLPAMCLASGLGLGLLCARDSAIRDGLGRPSQRGVMGQAQGSPLAAATRLRPLSDRRPPEALPPAPDVHREVRRRGRARSRGATCRKAWGAVAVLACRGSSRGSPTRGRSGC